MHVNAPTVLLNHHAHPRQSYTRARYHALNAAPTVETLENVWQVLLGDANTLVLDGQYCPATSRTVFATYADGHGRARRAVFDGVG
jgi:hypothetical protein